MISRPKTKQNTTAAALLSIIRAMNGQDPFCARSLLHTTIRLSSILCKSVSRRKIRSNDPITLLFALSQVCRPSTLRPHFCVQTNYLLSVKWGQNILALMLSFQGLILYLFVARVDEREMKKALIYLLVHFFTSPEARQN